MRSGWVAAVGEPVLEPLAPGGDAIAILISDSTGCKVRGVEEKVR